jgi:hypothetical protein
MRPAVKRRFVTLAAAACLIGLIGCNGDKSGSAPTKVQALPSATTLPAPTLAASEKPVILLYQDSYSRNLQAPREQVASAVWSDGRIVWRANGTLLQSRIDVKRIDDLLQRLHRVGVFGHGKAYDGNTGPDSDFDVIEVRLADRVLQMNSWHEVFEKNPKLVVTSHGVESLDGRDRSAVLAAQPPEYQHFRRVWSDIRATVESWTPSEGEAFTGAIPLGRGG